MAAALAFQVLGPLIFPSLGEWGFVLKFSITPGMHIVTALFLAASCVLMGLAAKNSGRAMFDTAMVGVTFGALALALAPLHAVGAEWVTSNPATITFTPLYNFFYALTVAPFYLVYVPLGMAVLAGLSNVVNRSRRK